MSHSHSHQHGHNHGHSHGEDKWKPDFSLWENFQPLLENNRKIVDIVASLFEDGNHDGNMKLLDFGCGAGLCIRDLVGERKLFSSAVGADVDPEFLKYMKEKFVEKYPESEDKVAALLLTSKDASELREFKTQNEKFDMVLCTFVLGHIREEEIPDILISLCEATKQNGKSFVLIAEFDEIDKQHPGHDMKKGDKFVSDGGHAHTSVSRGFVENALQQEGFEIVQAKNTSGILKAPTGEDMEYFLTVGRRI